MTPSAQATDTDRHPTDGSRQDAPGGRKVGAAPFARSQRELVIASLLRRPETNAASRRDSR